MCSEGAPTTWKVEHDAAMASLAAKLFPCVAALVVCCVVNAPLHPPLSQTRCTFKSKRFCHNSVCDVIFCTFSALVLHASGFCRFGKSIWLTSSSSSCSSFTSSSVLFFLKRLNLLSTAAELNQSAAWVIRMAWACNLSVLWAHKNMTMKILQLFSA